MQSPTSIEGLRAVLSSLGFSDILTGLDVNDPNAQQQCRDQINWLFSQSEQTGLHDTRRKQALSYIDRFPMWSSNGPSSYAQDAADELRALMDEEMVPEAIEVQEVVENESGESEAIVLDDDDLLDEAQWILD